MPEAVPEAVFHPCSTARVAIDVTPTDPQETRFPGRLLAGGCCRRWESPASLDLAGSGLPAALATLRQMDEAALLVGLLPYPGGSLPATLLLFDRHDHLEEAESGTPTPCEPGPAFRLTRPFTADSPPQAYRARVARILDYLRAGDAYQVNLAQRFTATCEGDARILFEHLRARHRPPHAAWVDLGDAQVLCLSPESFLSVNGRRVVTRPIKGTRRRGNTAAEDAAIRAELSASPKDKAENLMIVDLLRNDLGRVCVPGSVLVPDLFRVESFRNVHHLVSTVTGELAPGKDIPDLLAACFPGGSITGAPKRRAMEIISELEPCPREIYCGTIFWMTADGRFGSNIAIRTLLARDGLLSCWAGAGIVADSDPVAEQQECLDKVGAFMREAESAFLKP